MEQSYDDSYPSGPPRKWYVVGAVNMIGSQAILFAALIFAALKSDREMVVFEAPGSTSVTVVDPGHIVVWHVKAGVFNGTAFDHAGQAYTGLRVEFTEVATGESFPMRESRVTEYSGSSRDGESSRESVGGVDLPRAGQYDVTAEFSLQEPLVIAVGPSVFRTVIGNPRYMAPALFGFAGVFTGVGILAATRVRRRSAEMRLRHSARAQPTGTA